MANNNILWLFGFLFIIVIIGVGIYIYFKYKNTSFQPQYTHGFPMRFDSETYKYILWDPNAAASPLKTTQSDGGYYTKS